MLTYAGSVPRKVISIAGLALMVTCFFTSGCALRLYEYPANEPLLAEKGPKEAVNKNVEALATVLNKRAEPRIEPVSDRLIRKDLQDFIDSEWEDGMVYMEKMKLNLLASDANGTDGLLISKDNLPIFPTNYAFNLTDNIHPGTKLSFIHISDVQLRDERVYMFEKRFLSLLDYVSDGFAQEPEMILYDYAYYLTQIGIMKLMGNWLPGDEKPGFMIHTGDALHMGVVSELYEFLYTTNKLDIPWYNLLGNHDYQVYGNLYSRDVGVVDPNMGFQTVSTRYNFINMHGKGFHVDPSVYFSPDNSPDDDTLLTGSVYNGFDRKGESFLEKGLVRERRNKPCKDCPGYYYFEALAPMQGAPGIVVIALDTTTKDFRFAKGTVYRHHEAGPKLQNDKKLEQINWLRDVLEEYARKGNWMVLAFGHHALNSQSFFDESYKEVKALFQTPKYNVVAYFCGHTHEHWVQYHPNEDNPGVFGFWEIVTDSIMEYPKKGSLVHILCTNKGEWEIVIRSHWPYFLDQLSEDAPDLLRNAQKCYDASKRDMEGKKKLARYKDLDPKHHDAILRIQYPKDPNTALR